MKGIALYCIGLMVDDIATWCEISWEPFRNKVTRVFTNDLWDDLEDLLLKKCPALKREDFAELLNTCSESRTSKSAFRSAGKLCMVKWSKMTEEEKARIWSRATEVASCFSSVPPEE